MSLNFGGPGVTPTNKLGFGNRISLAAGETWLIQPAGWYWVKPGPYTCLQVYDPILLTWVTIGGGGAGSDPLYIGSDGENYRLANLTGLAVGALITNVGSGYTSAPTVTISGSNSIWRTVVGGSVATPTISNGGSNYTYAPNVTFSAPPAGGVQATGVAVLTSGAVSSITMINVGAGYTSPPIITITNDPREGLNGVTAGYNAAAVCTLTNAQKVTALICTDPGNTAQTSVPSFTISGGGGSSFAATAIMCWSILTFTPGGTNTGWGTTTYGWLSALDQLGSTTITAGSTNPAIQQGLVKTRMASIAAYSASGSLTGTVSAAASLLLDQGIYTSVPTVIMASGGAIFAATTVSFGMGGLSDTSYISS